MAFVAIGAGSDKPYYRKVSKLTIYLIICYMTLLLFSG